MKIKFIIHLFLLSFATMQTKAISFESHAANGFFEAPLYKINLDESPETRWNSVAEAYKDKIKHAAEQYFGGIPRELQMLAEIVATGVDYFLPSDYGKELVGLSKATGISLGNTTLLNIMYDVTAYCTGIIANDIHGGLWHGRNLDYGDTTAQTEVLKLLTIRVDFYKGGELHYSAVTFAGYVGVMTGWKARAFGLSANERDKGSLIQNLLSAMKELLSGGRIYPVTMIARLAFEQDADFTTAIARLTTTQLIAPVYYIVSGNATDEGVVIVRDQYKTLGVNQLNQTDGKWFVVQTNYDPWVQPPAHDDRRNPAIKAMNALGQSAITMETMFQMMSMHPVLNNHTTYSSVYSPTYPYNSTTVIRN